MARIAPLAPLRYDLSRVKGGLTSVIAPPYDVIGPGQRAELAAREPHNVVRLELPEGEGDARYANAARLLASWRESGVLVRDDQPAFYRVDQSFQPPGAPDGAPWMSRRGFLALVELVPFSDRVVLPHERTLSGPKEDRLKLFRATGANLSPGFMLYRDAARALDGPLNDGDVIAEATAPDGARLSLAKVRKRPAIDAIIDGIARSTLLIADGHHRYETALRYSQEVTEAHPGASRLAEHRFFMTFLANGDDPSLVVFPTHRHVHSLVGFASERLWTHAKSTFDVQLLPRDAEASSILQALERAGQRSPSFAVVTRDGQIGVLTLRADVHLDAHPTLGRQPSVLRHTDVALLHAGILEHLLGITPEAQAAKTNLWYPQDARAALAELRAGKGDALLLMNATPVRQVREVAEAGEVMPQKSTFFHPKVPTGLAIHTPDPERHVG